MVNFVYGCFMLNIKTFLYDSKKACLTFVTGHGSTSYSLDISEMLCRRKTITATEGRHHLLQAMLVPDSHWFVSQVKDPDVSRLWLPSFAKLPVSLWRHRGTPPHRWRRLVIPAPDPHQNFRTFVNVSVCLRLPKTNAYRWFVLPDASIAWATSLRHPTDEMWI